jgi:hypothetical protein
MTEQDRTIIRALRCSASVPPEDEACRKCAYGIVEKLELGDGNEHEIVSCDTDRIAVDAADRLEELTGGTNMKTQKYIVRCDRSGVFYGEIEKRDRQDVIMKNARCLWRWYGAASLMQMALEGVKQPKDCKFTVTVDSLEVLDAIEILPCTDAAVKSIEAVEPWKA